MSGELEKIYIQLEAVIYEREIPKLDYTSSVRIERFLRFPGMQNRLKAINSPLLNTCGWLPRVKAYSDWIAREKVDDHHGLLQVMGKPGSGKSTTMKRAFESAVSKFSGTTTCVAGFFFNKRGSLLEHSYSGMFRSLLHQILRFHPHRFPALLKLQEQESQEHDDQISTLCLPSLRDMFQDFFLDPKNDIRTIIFVDALDECDEPGNREIAYFFRHLTDSAYNVGVQLDVCLSRRDFPNVLLRDCPEVRLEMFTRCDIEYYISRQLEIAGFGDNETMKLIRREIADKADGVFLWVILVIDEIIKERDNGRNEKYLLREIRRLPAQLNKLFTDLLDPSKMSESEIRMALRLYQWAVLSTSPLRLREWHHILAFIQDKPPTSLAEWKDSIYYTATDEQLVKQLRVISRGLVEIKMDHYDNPSEVEDMRSAGAGAGSLDSSSGESRIVQLIHESVRAFFVEGGEWLSKASDIAEFPKNDTVSFCAEGHIALMKSCFQYLAIEELQEFCDARLMTAKQIKVKIIPKMTKETQPQPSSSSCASNSKQILNQTMELQPSQPSLSPSSCTSTMYSHLLSHIQDAFASDDDDSDYDYPLITENNQLSIHNPFAINNNQSPPYNTQRDTRDWALSLESPSKRRDSFSEAAVRMPFDHSLFDSNCSLRSASFGSSASSHDTIDIPRHKGEANGNAVARVIESEPGENIQKRSEISDLISEPMDFHSLSAKSKALDEYLALESYAVNRVFLHARLAQNAGADPMPIIRLLHSGCYWQRWLSLQENITKTTSLLSLAVEQGLDTWVDCIMGCDSTRPPTTQTNAALLSAILLRQTPSIRILVVHGVWVDSKRNLRNILRKKRVRQTFLAALEEIHAGDKTDGAILSKVVPDYLSVLFQALGAGDFDLVQDFLNFDVSVKHMLCDNIHDFIKESYCEKGHLFSALKFFVDNGANINERNASGESLVHIAVKSLDADLLHALVLAGADVDAKDDQKLTPFHRLVQMASHASPSYTLQQLVSFGADACAKDSEGRTPLHLIAGNDAVNSAGFKKSQYLHSVKREDAMRPLLVELIDAGADVNATNPSEWTSLHYICHEYGREAFIQDLVRAGADINAKDSMGQTALHHSVESTRSRKLVEELIANGATIHAKDTKHRTPIDIILEDFEREGLYPETIYDIEALISAGAHFDVTRRDSCGRTPLYKATLAGDKRLAELLVRHGADINEKDEEGRSALHIAFALATNNELISDFWKLLGKGRIIADSESRMEFCGVLLDLAADVSAKTITGLTVLHIAADAGIYGLIERLVALGAGLDERDHLGRTPLFLAAAQGYRYAVDTLLKSGANARIGDQAGISPLKRASEATYATSDSTARLLCAHLQGLDSSFSCQCKYGKGHVGAS